MLRDLWKTYKYIYYWLYTWQKNLWGESDAPEFNASIGLSLSMGCNILSAIVLIDIIFNIKIFPNGIPRKEALIGIIILFLIHYFVFVHKGKYKRIEKEFINESNADRK